MEIKEIKENKYRISYSEDTASIVCKGSLMLNGALAYGPILKLMQHAADRQQTGQLNLDVRDLKFLNSSGINMMTRFVVYIGEIKRYPLEFTFTGYKRIAWQGKLAINLQRLLPQLEIKME
ncbi:MAG: hypothetical protein GY862_20035 [Gammaproteobacteria bacterium]|nr:hypothetical protein [Gammaproteobacteria bacterium]